MWKKQADGGAKLQILVAEDNPHDQLLFALAVEDSVLDASITFADDGVEVLEKLEGFVERRATPDIVILDLQMPRLDGHAVLSKIRANPDFDSLAVVVFSSSVHPAEVQRSLDRGAMAHIVKPSSYEELEEFVNSLQERAHQPC